MTKIRHKASSFVLIYSILISLIGLLLFQRYEELTQNYIQQRVSAFDLQTDSFRLMQDKIIDNFYHLFLDSKQIALILKDAQQSDPQHQAILRRELLQRTDEAYTGLKPFGVTLLLFELPDTVAFLRLHNPEKFGDSLKESRPSVNWVQREHKRLVAYETGKVFDGFRTIHPVFYDNAFVGSIEIGYSFLALKKQLLMQSQGAYTFLIQKSVLQEKSTPEMIEKYYQKSELSPDFLESKESSLALEAKGFKKDELKRLLQRNRILIKKALAERKLQGIRLYDGSDSALLVIKPVKEFDGNQPSFMIELTSNHHFFNDQWRQFLELMIGISLLIAGIMAFGYQYYRSIKILQQYKDAIDSSLIVSKTDRVGKITYANHLFEKISGYSEEELLGQPHRVVRHPDTPSAIFEDMWKTIKEKKIWQGMIKNRTKEGEEYYVNSTICPIIDENGEIVEYMGLREDVTALIQATQKAEQLRNEAQRAEAAKRDFLANMSHEIRTPLNGIMGFAKLLKEANLAPEQHRQAVIINEQSKTLLGIINDILDFSKIESGNLVLENVSINPFIEFENAFALFSSIAQEKEIDYRVLIDNAISEGIGLDILRVKQVMSNLISNALKFTPKGGSVEVRVDRVENETGGERLRFSVRDSGIGIASEKLSTIFSPFTQEDSSTTRKFGGTGLGLSISYKLVELFGAELHVESVKGTGSRFWFEMEVTESDEASILAMKFDNKGVWLVHSDSPYYQHIEEQLGIFHIPFHHCDRMILDALRKMPKQCDLVIVFDESDLNEILYSMTGRFKRIIFVGESDTEYSAEVIVIRQYDNCPSRLYNALLQADIGGMYDTEPVNNHAQQIWNGRRILVADDYEVNRILIEALLKRYEVIPDFALNGKEAYDKTLTDAYDLVLMDINMPMMDGIEATHRLRAAGVGVPIVALTANALPGDKERFLVEGMDDYLSKPIDPDQLAIVLEKYLGKSDEADSVLISSPEDENDAPTYDIYQEAREMLGLNSTVIFRLFDLFVETTPERLEKLESAIAANDNTQIGDESHAIKGAAGNLRLHQIRTIAETIEVEAKEGNRSDFELLSRQLREEFERIKTLHLSGEQ